MALAVQTGLSTNMSLARDQQNSSGASAGFPSEPRAEPGQLHGPSTEGGSHEKVDGCHSDVTLYLKAGFFKQAHSCQELDNKTRLA